MSANPVREINDRIRRAETRFGRIPNSVRLLAVSKTRPVEDIVSVAEDGQRAFGENYVQEAGPKIIALGEYGLEWHFIGAVQSNKTREIAENFSWVHTLDRLKVARRLNAQRPGDLPRLNVCIEVNISREESKAGISVAELPDFVAAVTAMPNLRLRGLMTLPAPTTRFELQRAAFRRLAESFYRTRREGMDTLSMGTTADFEAAIAEGATIVRIGTGIFGPRD
jgi:pyridoxal phosphate enzyme (YggS family)